MLATLRRRAEHLGGPQLAQDRDFPRISLGIVHVHAERRLLAERLLGHGVVGDDVAHRIVERERVRPARAVDPGHPDEHRTNLAVPPDPAI